MLGFHRGERVGKFGKLGLRQEPLALAALEQLDALRRVGRDQLAVGMGSPFEHRPEHGERARRGAGAAIDDRPAALPGPNVGLALAGGNVALEFHHVVMGQSCGELAAQQRLHVTLDILAAIPG